MFPFCSRIEVGTNTNGIGSERCVPDFIGIPQGSVTGRVDDGISGIETLNRNVILPKNSLEV